jgi:hypothetical protein
MTKFHRCIGHANVPTLQKMVKEGVVEGIELTKTKMPTCKVCIKAKHAQASFPKQQSSPPTSQYGEQVHCNVWGPAQV